jgi:hypothetical protein
VFQLSSDAALGNCIAEVPRAQSKEFLIKKLSDLCELCASVVDILHRKPGINR